RSCSWLEGKRRPCASRTSEPRRGSLERPAAHPGQAGHCRGTAGAGGSAISGGSGGAVPDTGEPERPDGRARIVRLDPHFAGEGVTRRRSLVEHEVECGVAVDARADDDGKARPAAPHFNLRRTNVNGRLLLA